ncbi:MAG: 2-amino-4-hydroxy-6-hydroxymethyldihydropteridine diphosphokinase [Gammaproteobacteria bacterium]
MSTAWIGLGSNLGDSRAAIERAFTELGELPASELQKHSRLYCSKPWGPVPQPDFVNAVAALETALAPEVLLDELLAIESRHGRERGERWGPRTLDLDLLLYGDETISTPRLQVPHPRLAERAFVLAPFAELAPDLQVPGAGTVMELLSRVEQGGVIPLAAA